MCAHLRRAHAELGAQTIPRRELVVRAEHHVRDGSVLRATAYRGRRAARDPGDDDAGFVQHLQPESVES